MSERLRRDLESSRAADSGPTGFPAESLTPPVDDGGAVILSVCGTPIFCSRADHEHLSSLRWRIGANGYAYLCGARKRGVQCLMHRMVAGVRQGEEIHHRNGNKLDNRRENLEVTTPSGHQEYHKATLIARSVASRVYPDKATCPVCKTVYRPHPSHRGRQIACSKSCGTILGKRRAKASLADAMLAHRKGASHD